VTSMEGQGAEVRRRRRGETAWTFEATGARFTTVIDPDGSMSWQRVLRALTNGSDRHHYYRRDGYQLRLERESFIDLRKSRFTSAHQRTHTSQLGMRPSEFWQERDGSIERRNL